MSTKTLGCGVCGNTTFREMVSKRFPVDQRLGRCGGCGVVRLAGVTSANLDYWTEDSMSVDIYDAPEVRAQVSHRYARYLEELTRLVGRGRTILDGGCGIGNFLHVARAAGWRVAGVEISPRAAAIARSRGFDVETARLEECAQPDGAFDAVTLWDTIEHLEAPTASVAAVAKKLRVGGVLLLETPDERFWMRGVVRRAFSWSRGRVDLLGYFYYEQHRYYFTMSSLRRTLAMAGLQVVHVWHDATAPKKARLKLTGWDFPLNRLVIPLLPPVLSVLRRCGLGNKLVVAARRIERP